MSAHIEIGARDGVMQGNDAGETLSAKLVELPDAGAYAGPIEIRLSTNGTTNAMRLTRTEADVFSLMLAKLADPESGAEDSAIARCLEEGRSITRDELIRLLLDLPRASEIDVQIGTEHVAITGVLPWGPKNWAALQCHRPDFLELLEAWRLPADIHDQIVKGTR